MKVRVLWPAGCPGEAFKGGEVPEAGSVVEVADGYARALVREGAVEAVKAPKPKVERATAAPGEKRG